MKLQNKTTTRLGGYLTAAVTCGTLASTASAAIVNLDISSIDGINAGVANGDAPTFNMFTLSPGLTGSLQLYNGYYGTTGLDGDNNLRLSVTGSGYASPRNFSSGSLIDASANFSDYPLYTAFAGYGATSPDFGAGSYIGFKSANNHYGYFEVTWQSATNTFQILSGAYEDQAGVGILAGAGASAVPEASTSLGLLALGAGGLLTRRRKQAA